MRLIDKHIKFILLKEEKGIDTLLEKYSRGICTSEEEKLVMHYLDSFQKVLLQ